MYFAKMQMKNPDHTKTHEGARKKCSLHINNCNCNKKTCQYYLPTCMHKSCNLVSKHYATKQGASTNITHYKHLVCNIKCSKYSKHLLPISYLANL
jgi:hypothetical protein